jgi:hypothetical protein
VFKFRRMESAAATRRRNGPRFPCATESLPGFLANEFPDLARDSLRTEHVGYMSAWKLNRRAVQNTSERDSAPIGKGGRGSSAADGRYDFGSGSGHSGYVRLITGDRRNIARQEMPKIGKMLFHGPGIGRRNRWRRHLGFAVVDVVPLRANMSFIAAGTPSR